MNKPKFRLEKDSLGEIPVPIDAYYQAQTQRAVENFPISGITLNIPMIKALAIIKKTAAFINTELELIPADISKYIIIACDEIINGKFDDQFPVDIFQTGSGTSSNMNINEVIASRASELSGQKIHPNDHINFGQSSNDVFPTAVRLASMTQVQEKLLPAMQILQTSFINQAKKNSDVVKLGRTHLMDATPVTFGQVFDGYARQIALGMDRIQNTLLRVAELPQGGTAVGTGINTHGKFASLFAQKISQITGLKFIESINHFESQACIDAPAELSAMLKVFACSLMKIANDLRWMNSGPMGGLAEISLKQLQPGSSIMPGKVNPIIEESICMVCAQVIGHDAAITVAAQSGNFELNTMYPLLAHNLLDSIELLTNSCINFAKRSIDQLQINKKKCLDLINKSPILATTLNPLLGYELTAKIVQKALKENRPVKEVAKELSTLSDQVLDKLLDPIAMTQGGIIQENF